MANFYIDIIDTQNDDLTTALENATKNSIVLRYNGKDALDDLVVVGSSLFFEILLPTVQNVDAALIHLFSGDETRWKIELRAEEEDVLIWNGFLLPDSYQEPYKNNNLPIGLEATDGLGRLKGKYLPDDYYTEEKSVVDIVSRCLSLTGLQMPLVFAPAIENSVEKHYENIYLDGTEFVVKQKQKDAYSILYDLAETLVSVVYQHLGYWYLEGLNKRSLTSYSSRLYDVDGNFVSVNTVNKIVREIEGAALSDPLITVIPPYGQITVTATQKQVQFADDLVIEKNDGWVPAVGVVEEVYATEWYHSTDNLGAYPDFYVKAKEPDYNVYLVATSNGLLNEVRLVQLLRGLFLKKGMKIKFTFQFEIDYYGDEDSNTIEDLVNDGDWTNPLDYFLSFNDEALLTNTTIDSVYYKDLEFTREKTADLIFYFIVPEDGILNLMFRQPYLDIDEVKIQGIFINSIEIEDLFFEETIDYIATVTDDFTETKEVELAYTDDACGISAAFRLAKLNEQSLVNYNRINIPVLSNFTQNGKYYAVVQLDSANLVLDNLASTYYTDVPVTNLEVIYNYQDGEQMVLETDFPLEDGSLSVRQYRIKNHDLDRSHWETWTDSVYQIEAKRYADAVLSVYSRLFDVAYPKVDATIKGMPLLFADMVRWSYIEDTLFVPTFLEFNFDAGAVTSRFLKSNYLVSSSLVPPIVNVGDDLYLFEDESTMTIDATAYDPDGIIVSYLWEQWDGDSWEALTVGFNTNVAEDIELSNLTGDLYEFRLTVTDNDGLTATDSLVIARASIYAVDFEHLSSTDEFISAPVGQSDYWIFKDVYKLIVSPLMANDTISFGMQRRLEANLTYTPNQNQEHYIAQLRLIKNDILLFDEQEVNNGQSSEEFSINYIEGDEIVFELITQMADTFVVPGLVRISVLTANALNTASEITGLPLVREMIRENGQ